MARTGRPKLHADPVITTIVLDRAEIEQMDRYARILGPTVSRSSVIRQIWRSEVASLHPSVRSEVVGGK